MNSKDQSNIPSLAEVEAERRRLRRRRLFIRTFLSTLAILIVVAATAILIATLFFPVLQVAGDSMEPTMKNGDVLVLMKGGELKTGYLCAVRVGGDILLKRVIAGPGDWVDIDKEGNVSVNNKLLNEPYVTEKSLGITDLKYPYQVPDNTYFVMGDHRNVSVDSRSSLVGCIPTERVIGRVVFHLWPMERISFVK